MMLNWVQSGICLLTGIWLAANLAFYLVFFRRRLPTRREAAVLSYQLASFSGLLAVVVWTITSFSHTSNGWRVLLDAAAVHGIYSITFLEFWALGDGGISGRILAEIERSGGHIATSTIERITLFGERKQIDRLNTVQALGLVRRRNNICSLTCHGRAIAAIVRVLAWLNNVRRTG